MSNLFQTWMQAHAADRGRPLFVEQDGTVQTVQRRERTLLRRSPEFESLMIETVEQGLSEPGWEGIVYVMHWLHGTEYIPLYVGKAEKRGKKNPISVNLHHLRTDKSKFGRWGDGVAYHIGDLSHVLFGFTAYRAPSTRHARWVERLFASTSPLRLREQTHVALIPCHHGILGPQGKPRSVPFLEAELIALALELYPEYVLNSETDPY